MTDVMDMTQQYFQREQFI